jgi:hypothetical protein
MDDARNIKTIYQSKLDYVKNDLTEQPRLNGKIMWRMK